MISFVMVGMGIILVINQAFLLKKVWLRHFSEEKLVICFIPILTLGFFFMGIPFLLLLILGSLLLSVSQSVLRVVMTSQITKKGDMKEQGMVLGVLSSVMSLSMIIGPILAGALFSVRINFPFWASATFSVLAFVILVFDGQRKRKLRSKINEQELEMAEQKIEFVG